MGERHRDARRAEVERNDAALLSAARVVVAADGAHASVAAIATEAGVGVGTLYRRYTTKEELLQHLCRLSLEEYLVAAEVGLANPDPWEGLVEFATAAIMNGTGALGPVAGTIEVTVEMAAISERGDAVAAEVVARARRAGVLRRDVSDVDIVLLIEQLGRSPLVEQIRRTGRADLLDAATSARRRLVLVALSGLRAGDRIPLPEPAPGWELFTERWRRPDDPPGDGRTHAGRGRSDR